MWFNEVLPNKHNLTHMLSIDYLTFTEAFIFIHSFKFGDTIRYFYHTIQIHHKLNFKCSLWQISFTSKHTEKKRKCFRNRRFSIFFEVLSPSSLFRFFDGKWFMNDDDFSNLISICVNYLFEKELSGYFLRSTFNVYSSCVSSSLFSLEN